MFNQLFHKRSKPPPKENTDVNETFKTLILAKLDRIESENSRIRLEWAETYDKIMHLYDRTRKRVQAAEKAYQREEPIVPTPAPPMTRLDVLQSFYKQNGGD